MGLLEQGARNGPRDRGLTGAIPEVGPLESAALTLLFNADGTRRANAGTIRDGRAAVIRTEDKTNVTKNFKGWPALGLVIAASLTLTACGGSGSSSSTSVRMLNATLTHPSIDLLVNSAAALSGVATDTLSAYVSPSSGSVILQVNDNGGSTALTTLQPTIGSGAHDTLVVYEGASGAIKTTLLPEDATLPASGASGMRVLNAAVDAGAIDVYVTPYSGTSVDLSTVTPTFTQSAQNFVQLADTLTLTPGTYEVRVTGQGNKSDLRADLTNVVLASQQLGLLVLTPTSGGVLLNAGVLLEQVATTYTAQRNTNARVRLVSGLTGGATVSASTGSTVIAPTATPSPAITGYATAPATGTLAVAVNGAAAAVPVSTLAAGSDNTLLVTGTPAAPNVGLIVDDNHLPVTATSSSTTTNIKLRLVNGTSGSTATTLALSFNSNFLASVDPGKASSTYATLTVPTSTTSIISVNTAGGIQVDSKTNLTLTPNSVYTFFVLGDATSPPTLSQLRQDR